MAKSTQVGTRMSRAHPQPGRCGGTVLFSVPYPHTQEKPSADFADKQYRQESRPNGGEIYRLFRDSSWLDNGDHIPAASDVFPIRADSADDWGDTVQWTNPDGTQGHRIFNNKGIEAEISNSDNSSYAYYSAESFCNRQPASWVINGSRSAKQAFTGTYSIEGTAGTAAEVTLLHPQSGWIRADCWAKCARPGDVQLVLEAREGTTILTQQAATLADASSWQMLQCSVLVSLNQNVRCRITGSAQVAFIDDNRVFPITSIMTTATHDGLGRLTSQSDANNIPTRFYYNAFNEQALEADWRGDPIRGLEAYNKTADMASWTPDGFSPSYLSYKPNARYSFVCRGNGIVDDFSQQSLSRYEVSGTGTDSLEYLNGSLYFYSTHDTARHVDLRIPLTQFSDGWLAFDLSDSAETCEPGSQGTDSSFGQMSSLWFG